MTENKEFFGEYTVVRTFEKKVCLLYHAPDVAAHKYIGNYIHYFSFLILIRQQKDRCLLNITLTAG